MFYPPLSAIPQDSCNNLTELDSRISQLQILKILNLTSNRLKELPAAITKLKNLEELDLSLNQDLNIVDEIPKLKQLPKLRTLKIVDVQFREQGEIVKRALAPRVRIITSIDEYFSLDSLEFKKVTDSVMKNLQDSTIKHFKIKPSEN